MMWILAEDDHGLIGHEFLVTDDLCELIDELNGIFFAEILLELVVEEDCTAKEARLGGWMDDLDG